MNISKRLNIVSISKSSEIKNILDNSQKVYFRYGIVFLHKDSIIREKLRIAILVKKQCGNAVKRNYIKRIGRYFVYKNITLFKEYNRVIFLFVSNKNFRYKKLRENLIKAFSK